MRKVLFLCTGNYYRSRFAEEVFNDRAAEAGLDWRAESRALAIERGTNNIGPISPSVTDGEHRPLMLERYAAWHARTEFWDVEDVGLTPSRIALPAIRGRVEALLANLKVVDSGASAAGTDRTRA